MSIFSQTITLQASIDPLDPNIGVTASLRCHDPLEWFEREKDPVNISSIFYACFEHWCAVEHKHGYVAMIADLGMLFCNANIEFSVYLCKEAGIMNFSNIPNDMNGLFSVLLDGLTQIFFFYGLCEFTIRPARNYSCDYSCGYGQPCVVLS